uniref:Skin secretory protein xP2-like n=1 Tax=Petromyzon marinus TaxID=7757 RepID=A0AAJ7THN7_PETMA|nr:skin secretory protein xP2-like [Petromyzon marinus]
MSKSGARRKTMPGVLLQEEKDAAAALVHPGGRGPGYVPRGGGPAGAGGGGGWGSSGVAVQLELLQQSVTQLTAALVEVGVCTHAEGEGVRGRRDFADAAPPAKFPIPPTAEPGQGAAIFSATPPAGAILPVMVAPIRAAALHVAADGVAGSLRAGAAGEAAAADVVRGAMFPQPARAAGAPGPGTAAAETATPAIAAVELPPLIPPSASLPGVALGEAQFPSGAPPVTETDATGGSGPTLEAPAASPPAESPMAPCPGQGPSGPQQDSATPAPAADAA